MSEIGKYRFIHKGEYHYFTLKDLTMQSKVYRELIAGKKSFKILDLYTGFNDANGVEIYTRDRLSCKYLPDDDFNSPEISIYTVRFGECHENMYGCHFKGFYIKEDETGYCFSLFDEFKNKNHSKFIVIQDKEKLSDLQNKEKIKWIDALKEDLKTRKEIRKLKLKRFLNLIKTIYLDIQVILFRKKQELKKRQKQKMIQKMIKKKRL